MNMKKMFAGLIALVAGLALSAGSAFATNGYVGGDHTRMKLVPWFEAGDTKATIIGIQNLSPQEQSTMDKNADVQNIQSFLAGNMLGGASPSTAQTRAIGLINTEFGGTDITGTETLDAGELNLMAAAEAALEKAMEAQYTEHLFVVVNAYDTMGTMMASATLCLAEHQFGYVSLQGSAGTDMGMQGKVLSVMDGDLAHGYGYVKVMAENRKFTGCGAAAPNTLQRVDDDTDSTNDLGPTNSRIAAWTIIQDVGMGFFGTEVSTSTITMEQNAGLNAAADFTTDDGDPELACYENSSDAGDANTAAANITPNTSGDFVMSRCGLIPERHNILLTGTAPNRVVDVVGVAGTDDSSTVATNAIARYDVGDESMVYVWLAKGMDTDSTMASKRRMLDVTVKCEDGTVIMDEDVDGNMMPFKVAAPSMVTVIDPTMGDVGMATDMCAGDRGVLQITMPDNSHAGMVFTHITQMMGHYRMNFPGYSMADPDTETDATE